MMNFRTAFLIMSSCFLLACQGENKETIREYVGTEHPHSQNQGGTDSGGGNGINGHNIEDYAVNIQKDESFREHVLPLILKIAETHPRFASDMIHITAERTWYKIPVALNTLEASQIGISFGDKQLQQFALQNLKSVWINTGHYNKFETNESRARLLLHEILMGIRLMKLKNSLDNCYSEVAILKLDEGQQDRYQKQRDSCSATYIFSSSDPVLLKGVNSKLDLTGDDYDNIRNLGVMLWAAKGEVSKVELDAYLKANSFRAY